MSRPYGPADPYRRSSAFSRSFLPLALITLGVVVLLSNFASNVISDRARGGLIVFSLGAAFGVGRLTTGRYGYAVPAGILMAVGAYIVTQSMDVLRGASSAGLFFVLLGLGFVATYVVGLKAQSVWPLFLAAILIALGAVLLGVASLGPLASWSWIATYWPAALVLLGVWLLLRDSLPPSVQAPVGTIGGMLLLVYGVAAAAASIAAAGTFGGPNVETVNLEQPIAANQTLTINNTSGATTVHAGSDGNVHVVATRRSMFGGPPPTVNLTPDANGLTLGLAPDNRNGFPFGGSSGSVDYAINVPASVAIKLQSTSGKVSIDGLSGQVDVTGTSGELNFTNLSGPVRAQSTSGRIVLDNVAGEVTATTTNGSVRGTRLEHVRQVQTTNGAVSLQGVFVDAAQIRTMNGSVELTLLPGSAVTLDAHTAGGSIQPHNLMLGSGGATTRRDALTGTIGTPAPGAMLQVQTANGRIEISQ